MKRRTGYVPDPTGHRRTPFHHLARRLGGVAATFPAAASLFGVAPPVMDQGQTDSCTGHAAACGLYVAARPPWVPSPAEIYRNGRAIDRANPATPLTDDGAEPNQVFRAINEFGVRAMTPIAGRYSDADEASINAEPQLGDLEAESLTIYIADFSIDSVGKERLDEICLSIANRNPVTVAIAGGSDAFQGYSGGVLPLLLAPLDHYVTILSYLTLDDGSREFGIRNSWGDWGEAGNCRISEGGIAELGDLRALAVRRAA